MTPDAAPFQSAPLWFAFNELSARARADTILEGRERMNSLVAAITTVMDRRPAELVCIGANALWGAELAVGYTVSDWLASADQDQDDRDRKLLLLDIATKTDFPHEVGVALRNRFYLSEFLLEDGGPAEQEDARGLGAAFLLDGIAVSIPSEEQWQATRIPLRHMWLDERGTERGRDVEVLNLCGLNDAERVNDSLLEKRQHGLMSQPSSLPARKRECFPHLAFGLDVDEHIAALPTAFLGTLVRKLILLDDAARTWRRTPTTTFPVLSDRRSESKQTMADYGDLRVYRDADGVDRTYKLHCSLGGYRIHFRIMHEPRCLEIGYVGKHLPTKRFPN